MIFNAVGGCVNPYPVGAIYQAVTETSPASLFGGTWERLKDRFLLGAGDTYSAGSTGGEAEHETVLDEMPPHSHELIMRGYVNPNSGAGNWQISLSTQGTEIVQTDSVGGGQPHNNMPPYLTVYMWKRVA